MHMKQEGIKLEIQKEFMYNVLQSHCSLNDVKEANDIKKEIIKLIYPDLKDEEEELMNKAKESLTKFGDNLRVTVDTSKKINPYEAHRQLNSP